METQLDIPTRKQTAAHDIRLLCMTGNEGIGPTHLTKITLGQYCQITSVEDAQTHERDRCQRLVQPKRKRGVTTYLETREDTIFPEVIVALGNECTIEPVEMPHGVAVDNTHSLSILTIPAHADRHITDGQGRRLGIEDALKLKEQLAENHLDAKMVICATNEIKDSAKFVRQIFADLHLNLVKPTTSQSIYFDNHNPLHVFTNELCEITAKMGVPFIESVSTEGRLKPGQVLNNQTLKDFVCMFIGNTPGKVEQVLSEQERYDFFLLEIARFIQGLYKYLPYGQLLAGPKSEWKEAIDGNLACCAIGWKALGLVGNSLHCDASAMKSCTEDDSGIRDAPFDDGPLAALPNIPFGDKEHPLWLKNQIYQRIDGKTKIVKGSERRLARLLCQQLRIIASEYCNK